MARAWDEVATALVVERGDALSRYAYLLTGDVDDAADLVQDALVRTFGTPRIALTLPRAEAYVRRAILNQLLLAAASDWPFLVTMETGADYAADRFREHASRLRELVELGPRARSLPAWVSQDLPFPDLEPEWALPPEA